MLRGKSKMPLPIIDPTTRAVSPANPTNFVLLSAINSPSEKVTFGKSYLLLPTEINNLLT
jgi:hypothetical protein